MPTPNCDCPICVLYYADVQICDLRVVLTKKQKDKLHFTMRHRDLDIITANKEIESSVVALIYKADTTPLKVKHFCEVDKPEYSLKIERLSRNEYKFCFHSKMEPVPDEEADPLPMD
jgi:hypothetical protein